MFIIFCGYILIVLHTFVHGSNIYVYINIYRQFNMSVHNNGIYIYNYNARVWKKTFFPPPIYYSKLLNSTVFSLRFWNIQMIPTWTSLFFFILSPILCHLIKSSLRLGVIKMSFGGLKFCNMYERVNLLIKLALSNFHKNHSFHQNRH